MTTNNGLMKKDISDTVNTYGLSNGVIHGKDSIHINTSIEDSDGLLSKDDIMIK